MSALPPEACRARVAARAVPPGPHRQRSVEGTVTATIDGSCVCVRVAHRYRNAFQPVLRASLRPQPGGTRIEGAVGMHPAVKGFLFLWFGALLTVEVALAVAMGAGAFEPAFAGPPGFVMPLLVPACLATGGAALVAVGRRVARGEAVRLVAFLSETLDAEPLRG